MTVHEICAQQDKLRFLYHSRAVGRFLKRQGRLLRLKLKYMEG